MPPRKTIVSPSPTTLAATALVSLLAAAPGETLGQTFPVRVEKGGDGNGVVLSDVVGIDCGADCDETYPSGTVVTLTAHPASDSTFLTWSGDCYSFGLTTCTLTVDEAKRVTAWFYAKSAVLTVTLAGDGTGLVTSSPPGIGCGLACSHPFPKNTVVTLTATPDPGTTFGGWIGGWAGPSCSGMGTCIVSMDRVHTATALFYRTTPSLTVLKTGTGTGRIVDDLAGIDCGADCSESYPNGTVVTLRAEPDLGFDYLWIGPCQAGRRECITTMDGLRFVVAVFYPSNKVLTVINRTGSGRIESRPPGVDCGTDCSEPYPSGTVVELVATPDPGFTFAGWGGDCAFTFPGTAPCRLTLDRDRKASAAFVPATATLTVARAGDGSGRVTSSPAGIDCGTDCSEIYPYRSNVTLTAGPDAGSTFTGWAGSGCSGTGTCSAHMSSAQSVTATFTRTRPSLRVLKSGSGQGHVASDPPGIDCGTACFEEYPYGTRVTLTARAEAGSVFAGWGGACLGTGSCILTLDNPAIVSATFLPPGQLLTVLKNGDGSGTVRSTPTGIDCGGDCSETYASGTRVSLSAAADGGSTFAGWGGACGGTGGCTLTMNEPQSVTAIFDRPVYTLSVNKGGNGAGTVSSASGRIFCGPDCSDSYLSGEVETLRASPEAGSVFTGWSGACSGTGSCTVTMHSSLAVTANFGRPQSFTLSVSKVGPAAASGLVTSNPAGIDCGGDCSHSFVRGTVVTLIAVRLIGVTFAGWEGDCTGDASTCTLTMNGPRSVIAVFTAGPR